MSATFGARITGDASRSRRPTVGRPWAKGSTLVLSVLYPMMLLACILAFRLVGEKWWLTAVGLYLPRIGFAAPLPLLVLALLLCRAFRMLITQVLAAVLVVFPLMGLVVHFPRSATKQRPVLRVLSLNANAAFAGVPALLDAVDRHAPDLVLMQEIVVGSEHKLLDGLKARFETVNATSQFIVACHFPLSAIDEPGKFPFEGHQHSPRFMRYIGHTPLGSLVIYNIHPVSPRQGFYKIRGGGLRREIASGRLFEGAFAPTVQSNSDLRASELEALIQHSRSETLPVLIAGDTNLPGLDPVLARLSDGFIDGFSEAGWGFGYTFPSNGPWMRIDRMLVSPSFRFERFEVDCRGSSDHLCIVAELSRR